MENVRLAEPANGTEVDHQGRVVRNNASARNCSESCNPAQVDEVAREDPDLGYYPWKPQPMEPSVYTPQSIRPREWEWVPWPYPLAPFAPRDPLECIHATLPHHPTSFLPARTTVDMPNPKVENWNATSRQQNKCGLQFLLLTSPCTPDDDQQKHLGSPTRTVQSEGSTPDGKEQPKEAKNARITPSSSKRKRSRENGNVGQVETVATPREKEGISIRTPRQCKRQRLQSPRNVSCPECSQSFRTESARRSHIAVVHRGQKRFSCSQCQMTFGASGDVTRHVNSVHRGLRPFACESCDASFARAGTLKRHTNTMHKAGNS